MPLAVTDRASIILKDALSHIERRPGQIFRLSIADTGEPSLDLDDKRDGDQVVEYLGDAVMVVGQRAQNALTGVTLDAFEQRTDEGIAVSLHLLGRNGASVRHGPP